jgi:asparagine synthase (glutamine-hydrolysing)
MCGIAGFTTLQQQLADCDAVVRRMTACLRPRGPDGEGYHSDAHVHLGHRRLSIIDLEGGAQPMSIEGGRYQIVFNGEIYNYIELRADLEKRGRVFATKSDTEVILHQFAVAGIDGIRELNGMFAFALWDRDARQLFLARDRIGIKPLHYFESNGELVFASELKALLAHPAARRRLDLLSVSKYLTYGYVPAPHTIFEGIHKLEPGYHLRFDANGLRKTQYWDIPMQDNPISGRNVDECAEQALALLRDSVRLQLRSDVPVGVFLSGGLDSSALTTLAAQATGGKLRTFSIGFEEATYDESPYAREVAEWCGTEHHQEILSQRRAVGMLSEALGILDEPFADASILPTYLLSRFTAGHVKVALGGDGGDELFAGYPSFQAHKIMEKLSVLPVTWRDALTRAARRIPVSHRYASVDFLVQQFFRGAGVSPEIRFFLWMGYFGNDQKQQLLTPSAREALLRKNPFEDILNYVRLSGLISDFPRILYLCMKLYLQDGILVKVDRASMAHSLEVRVPYLDHHLVEFAAGIQPGYKLRGLKTKYVFKRAVRGLLPRRIITRRKAGFMIPLATWIENDLRAMVEDLCAPSALSGDGLFDPRAVRTLLDEHFQRRRDHRKLIWALLVFQHWRKRYGGSQ